MNPAFLKAFLKNPVILSSDGASVFTWGIFQRISSAYHATSNKCAEVGVKSGTTFTLMVLLTMIALPVPSSHTATTPAPHQAYLLLRFCLGEF